MATHLFGAGGSDFDGVLNFVAARVDTIERLSLSLFTLLRHS